MDHEDHSDHVGGLGVAISGEKYLHQGYQMIRAVILGGKLHLLTDWCKDCNLPLPHSRQDRVDF